jgi:hypothetical protein
LIRVDDDAGQVGSSELGGTGIEKFETLTLHDGTPHTTESADRYVIALFLNTWYVEIMGTCYDHTVN